MKLGVLGTGFPLYFHFKLFITLVFFCSILVVGIPCTVFNMKQDKGGEWIKDNENVLLTKTTLGNHGKGNSHYHDNTEINLIVALNSSFILILFLLSLLLRAKQSDIIDKIDSESVTPSDFTLMAYNLPLNKSSIELKTWLSSSFPVCKEIRSISYCYNIRGIISL